jgi:hypothetical protein
MVRFQKYDLIVMREIVRQTVAIMVVRGGVDPQNPQDTRS